jgi:hypothetical protein
MQLVERLTRAHRLRLPWQPWSVLGPLCLLEWAGTAVFARRATHAGWYFHNDTHATWTWTGSWLLGHAHLSGVDAGWGWSYLLLPISWISGADYLSALPILIVLQGLIFLPLGLLLAYGAAARLGGRAVAYFAAGLWALGPFLVVAQLLPSGKQAVESELVAPVLGLTGSAALPGALALLTSAWLVLRALDGEEPVNGAAAGLAAGLAIAIEPLNGLYLVAPALAFLLARRARAGAAFAAGLVPFLVVLALWRARGPGGLDLGGIPEAFHFSAARLSYTFSWIREGFWSLRLLQWIAAAGFVALLRVSPAKAAFAGSWLLAFVLFRGSDPTLDARAGTFWPAVLPALPAFGLLAASLPLLVPGWRPRAATVRGTVPLRALFGLAALACLVPLVLIAAGSPARGRAALTADGSYVPASRDLGLRATVASSGTVTLSWPSSPHGSSVLYTLYREGKPIATTYSTQLTDAPGRGRATYRLAWQASEVVSGGVGISVELSRPLTVDVR